MHQYEALVSWSRRGEKFTDNRYSRKHEWEFDGGVKVPASAAPAVVPAPYSAANAVDPEEALVAATSSCHMLGFLYYAAKQGFVVESYQDRSLGDVGKNAQGKSKITRVTLYPKIMFSPEKTPTPEELKSLHHAAHQDCTIANSLNCEVVVEG